MTREEFIRTFGPEQLHNYKPVPRTPTFVMTDTINNKAQIALTSKPYESPQCRQRTNRRIQRLNKPQVVEEKITEIVVEIPKKIIPATVDYKAICVSLLNGLKQYISSHSNNFSCILNIKSLVSYKTYEETCNATCIFVENQHDAFLFDVKKIKNDENILMVNALVPSDFDVSSFKHKAYKSNIISNCITNEDYNELPTELPYRLNTSSITNISNVNNFVIIKDYSNFNTKARFLLSAKNLQHDLLIIEPYYNKGHYFTTSDIEFMKYKKGNKLNRRLVYAYLSMTNINEQSKFYDEAFMEDDKIKYWSQEWKQMLYEKDEGSMVEYFIKIGYDGIFIDNIKE